MQPCIYYLAGTARASSFPGARSKEPNTTPRWQGKPRDGSWGQAARRVVRQAPNEEAAWGDARKAIYGSGPGPAAVNRARCSLGIARVAHGGKAGWRSSQEGWAQIEEVRGQAQMWLYHS